MAAARLEGLTGCHKAWGAFSLASRVKKLFREKGSAALHPLRGASQLPGSNATYPKHQADEEQDALGC